jgi:hypothetical protein
MRSVDTAAWASYNDILFKNWNIILILIRDAFPKLQLLGKQAWLERKNGFLVVFYLKTPFAYADARPVSKVTGFVDRH